MRIVAFNSVQKSSSNFLSHLLATAIRLNVAYASLSWEDLTIRPICGGFFGVFGNAATELLFLSICVYANSLVCVFLQIPHLAWVVKSGQGISLAVDGEFASSDSRALLESLF